MAAMQARIDGATVYLRETIRHHYEMMRSRQMTAEAFNAEMPNTIREAAVVGLRFGDAVASIENIEAEAAKASNPVDAAMNRVEAMLGELAELNTKLSERIEKLENAAAGVAPEPAEVS